MEDVSRLKINDNTYNIKDSVARKGIETLQKTFNTLCDYSSETETLNFNIQANITEVKYE